MSGSEVRVSCHYCDAKLSAAERTRDHIVPKAMGGELRIRNTVWSCQPCNLAKGASWPTCVCTKCAAARRQWRQQRPKGQRRADRRWAS